MVRRIVWTKRANIVFIEILEYYFKRNGTKSYSKKLNSEIKQTLNHISKYPFLGKKTDIEKVRVFIRGNYQIYYKLKNDRIVVLLIWDSRQDPNKLRSFGFAIQM